MTNPSAEAIPELITDPKTFRDLRAECEKVIDTGKRLPDFVFRRKFDRHYAFEHAYVCRREFGAFLARLAAVCNDASVSYMTVVPDAEDVDYIGLGSFGLASFEPATLCERYVKVMKRNGSVNSFCARGGDVGVFWGSSLTWAICCDRISWELGIVAVPDGVDVPEMGLRCHDAAWVCDYMESRYRLSRPAVAADFNRRFVATYSITDPHH